jgi:hypothetical protein
VARGSRVLPQVADEHAELLRRKGEEYERAYLERLRAEGRASVEIELGKPWDFEADYRRVRARFKARFVCCRRRRLGAEAGSMRSSDPGNSALGVVPSTLAGLL